MSQFISAIRTSSGISISGIDFSSNIYPKDLVGISSGVDFSYAEHQHWRLNTKLNYVERGGRDRFIFTDESGNAKDEGDVKFNLNFLTLGTNFEYLFYTRIINSHIALGPRIDYLVSTTMFSDSFKKANYGFDLGIEIDRKIFEGMMLGVNFVWDYQAGKIADEQILSVVPKKGFLVTVGLEYRINKHD